MKKTETEKEKSARLKANRAKIAREKAKASALKFRSEFNKALRTALLAAFGFIIALSWREVITEWVSEVVNSSAVKGQLISALIVTLVSVIGIIIVTTFLKEN